MAVLNVYLVQFTSVLLLIYIFRKQGLSATLPYYIFMMVFLPGVIQLNFFGFFDFTVQRTVTLTILVLAIISARNSQTNSKIGLKYLILLLILWSILSNVNSVVPVISFKRMLAYVLEYFTIFIILSKYITDAKIINKILISIQIALFLAAILGLVEYFNGWSFNSLFPSELGRFSYLTHEMEARSVRLRSVFPHPILFGSAIAMTLPITFHLIVTTKGKIAKTLLWISLFLMLFCLFKTTSRGPWLASAIGLSILFVFCKPTRKYLVVVGFALILILFLRPGIFISLKGIFFATLDPTTPLGSSYEYRYALFDVIQGALKENVVRFFMGYGQESFFYLGLEAEHNGRIHRFLSCDSAWAKILIEIGYVGFFISLLIFIKALVSSFISHFRYVKMLNNNFIIYATIMIVFYFMMTNVAIYGWGPNGYILWTAIALTFTHPNILSNTSEICNDQN